MPQPVFDRSTGWWSIRIRDHRGARHKIQLRKDPRWRKGGNWPPAGRPPRCPFDIESLARPFQDRDAAARLGIEVSIPRATDQNAFLAAYVASYAIAKRPESVRLLRQVVASWAAWCDSRGIRSVEQVSANDGRAYLEHRTSSGAAHNTVRVARGLLSTAFERAFQDGLITVNPWRRVKLPGRNESTGTPSYTAAEVERIAAELGGTHRDLWLVGIYSGFRHSALRGLRWGDVRWSVPGRQHGYLECRAETSKGGKPYTVPLSEPLRNVLWDRHEANRPQSSRPGNRVFPGAGADGGIGRTGFAKVLRAACRRAGVPYKGHAWHSMRATFASLCHARGVNPRTIQAWMNHASIKMTDRYSHYSTALDDAEADKMGHPHHE